MNEIPSILSLHKEKSSQENSKNHIYSIVLNKCIDKIKYTNKHKLTKIINGYYYK